MIKVVEDLIAARGGSVPALRLLVGCLFHDSYGDLADYLRAVGAVWGESVRYRLGQAIDGATTEAQFGVGYGLHADSDVVGMHVLLMLMPEPDFRFAVEKTLRGYCQMLWRRRDKPAWRRRWKSSTSKD